ERVQVVDDHERERFSSRVAGGKGARPEAGRQEGGGRIAQELSAAKAGGRDWRGVPMVGGQAFVEGGGHVRGNRILLAPVLTCGGTAFAADDAALDGKWVVESMTKNGKPDDTWKGAVREHAGGKYTMSRAGGKSVSGAFKVDAANKAIDMMPNEGQY